MTYSIDLKERVLDYITKGGSKANASRIFQVSRRSIYNWLSRDTLTQKTAKRRMRKLDWEPLKKDVELYPDKLLRERADEFGVHFTAIWYALNKMGIKYKKNSSLQRKKPSKTNRISQKTSSNNQN